MNFRPGGRHEDVQEKLRLPIVPSQEDKSHTKGALGEHEVCESLRSLLTDSQSTGTPQVRDVHTYGPLRLVPFPEGDFQS